MHTHSHAGFCWLHRQGRLWAGSSRCPVLQVGPAITDSLGAQLDVDLQVDETELLDQVEVVP